MKKSGSLSKALKIYAEDSQKLRVGIFETATYAGVEDERLHVAQVAFWNEYGVEIEVPERQITIYRLINQKSGEFKRNGRFVRKAVSNFATTHTSPAHKINIPPRPFFRSTVSENKDKWVASLPKLVEKQGINKGLSLLGEVVKGDLVESIMTWTTPPNALSTIKLKGRDAPLRDTMQMSRSIGVEVSRYDES